MNTVSRIVFFVCLVLVATALGGCNVVQDVRDTVSSLTAANKAKADQKAAELAAATPSQRFALTSDGKYNSGDLMDPASVRLEEDRQGHVTKMTAPGAKSNVISDMAQKASAAATAIRNNEIAIRTKAITDIDAEISQAPSGTVPQALRDRHDELRSARLAFSAQQEAWRRVREGFDGADLITEYKTQLNIVSSQTK